MGWRPYGWHCADTPTRRSGPTRGRAGPPGWRRVFQRVGEHRRATARIRAIAPSIR